MGRKSAGPPTVVQQSANPWGPQVPHLGQLYATAFHNAFERPPATFYSGSTVAGFSPQELEAMNRGETRAREGSQSINMARDYARGILSGDPATMQATLGPRVGELLPQLQSQFNRGGMGTSSLARGAEQELIMRELSKLKESAADRLERLGIGEYDDIARLAAIGESRRDMDQANIDEQIRRHEFMQQEPANRLREYQAAILGHFQPTDTTQRYQPIGGSRLSGLLGGGLGGANLAAKIFGEGATSGQLGIGGLLGGLAGLF